MRNATLFILFGLSFVASRGHALSPISCGKSQFSDIRNLVKNISIIGADERTTFAEYAKKKNLTVRDVENLFSGTGVITCDHKLQTTAQLTGNNSVITTAAHAFFDDNCEPDHFKSCFFTVLREGATENIPVDMSSLKMGGCDQENRKIDWAVLRLQNPAPSNFRAYRLPPKNFKVTRGTHLIQIAGFAQNYKIASGTHPRNIVECRVHDVNRYEGYPLQTDCDSGGGTSGSAQFVDTSSGLIMVGIQVAQSSKVDGSAYDSSSVFNVSTQLEGPFYEALVDAVTQTGGPSRNSAHADTSNF